MALQLRRGHTSSLGKVIATSFAVVALIIQPLVSGNIPAAFADDGINTQAEFEAALADTTQTTISLSGGFSTNKQININRTLTLNGNGFTISPSYTGTGGGNDSGLAVIAGNPVINNLGVDGTAAVTT